MELVVHKNTLDKHTMEYIRLCRRQKLLDLTEPAEIDLYRLAHGIMSKEECTPKFMLWLSKHYDPLYLLPLFLALRNEDEVPEQIKIDAARKSEWGQVLESLHHPSDNVINALLEIAGENILYLKKPTQQQWRIALMHSHTEYPHLIIKCPYQTAEMRKIHVEHHGHHGLNYIKNPSEALKLVAAEKDGIHALASPKMQNPSEKVLLTAISATYGITELKRFLHYIPHPNHKIMCAIRHQINMNKKALAKLLSEPTPKPKPMTIEEQLTLARQACFDPIAAAKIGQNAESMQDQLNQLETLRVKMVNDLFNYKNPALAM